MTTTASATLRTAFITGASSGIGRATALELARLGFRLILTGRRRERLDELAAEVGAERVHLLTFDVRDRAAVDAAVASLPEAWRRVDVLVNNAGNAHGMAPLEHDDVANWDAMIDTNVKGFLYVAHAVLPLVPEGGHVVNMGSIAGKQAYANGGVYCASKFAVDAISQSMRLELLARKIRVSQILPGLVETEFAKVRFKGDEDRAAAVYQGLDPLRPEDIAEIIGFVVTRPARVNLADVVVLAGAQGSATVTFRE